MNLRERCSAVLLSLVLSGMILINGCGDDDDDSGNPLKNTQWQWDVVFNEDILYWDFGSTSLDRAVYDFSFNCYDFATFTYRVDNDLLITTNDSEEDTVEFQISGNIMTVTEDGFQFFFMSADFDYSSFSPDCDATPGLMKMLKPEEKWVHEKWE